MSKPFYITTTLPYVNAEPHMGHALEFVRADVIARWKERQGFDVYFNTGTDEHGQKLFEAAQKAGKPVQQFVDENAENFKKILPLLGINERVHFIRTTDDRHVRAATEVWKRVAERGYIYKKNYRAKYCVPCEETKTESELLDGRCPIHPNRELEIREEENYFFKYSEFGDRLLKLYESAAFRVVPDFRFNEVKEFIKRGLIDFSVSRLASKMSWGIPVPGDPEHVMYVWFDALPSYISTLGWPDDALQFERYWRNGTPTQYCGKDNNRFQSVMWQAMLLAAELPPTHTVVVNGFVTAEGGVKMSKSLGNGVDPVEVVREYGTEALRYFVCREISAFEDSPFTIERFKSAYNTNLANGLGNLVSRILKMYQTYFDKPYPFKEEHRHIFINQDLKKSVDQYLEKFDIAKAMDVIWDRITAIDLHIQHTRPFSLFKEGKVEEARNIVAKGNEHGLMYDLVGISIALEPFMPETARKIQEAIKANKLEAPLFLRKE